jgi:hypothetical protein
MKAICMVAIVSCGLCISCGMSHEASGEVEHTIKASGESNINLNTTFSAHLEYCKPLEKKLDAYESCVHDSLEVIASIAEKCNNTKGKTQ